MIKEIQFSYSLSLFFFIRTVIPALAAGGRSDDDPSSALLPSKGASIFAKLAPIIL